MDGEWERVVEESLRVGLRQNRTAEALASRSSRARLLVEGGHSLGPVQHQMQPQPQPQLACGLGQG